MFETSVEKQLSQIHKVKRFVAIHIVKVINVYLETLRVEWEVLAQNFICSPCFDQAWLTSNFLVIKSKKFN